MSQRDALIPSKYTIMVMSCDAYSDVWYPFAQAWAKFWPNCPFEAFLISENKDFKSHQIKNLKTNKRMNWGKMLKYALHEVQTPYIIYLQDDYLLRSPVDEEWLFRLLNIFEKTQAAYLRLLPWPGPDKIHAKYPDVGILNQDSKYRTSLQAGIWDRKILQEIVQTDDDGRFETWSIDRVKDLKRPFLCIKRNGHSTDINQDGPYPINYYATAVFQGKWLKEALRIYRKLGITIDTSHRGVMNRIDFLEYHERKKGTNSIKYHFLKALKSLLDRF